MAYLEHAAASPLGQSTTPLPQPQTLLEQLRVGGEAPEATQYRRWAVPAVESGSSWSKLQLRSPVFGSHDGRGAAAQGHAPRLVHFLAASSPGFSEKGLGG